MFMTDTTEKTRVRQTGDLSLLPQRNYDPSIGRFTSFDTFNGVIAEPLTLHKYAYAGFDPVNNVDPSGQDFISTLTTVALINVGVATVGTVASVLAAQYLKGSGSLGGQVGAWYTMRGFLNSMWIPQLFTRTDFMISRAGSDVYIRDPGLAKDNTALFRRTWMVDYAHKQGVIADGRWHLIEVPDLVDAFQGHHGDRPQVNSFWVGRISALKAKGSYEVMLAANGSGKFRNVGLEWVVEDYTDAHSFLEGWNEEGDWANVGTWWKYIAEGIVDIVGDKILSADYFLFINFYDDFSDDRLYIHQTEWN